MNCTVLINVSSLLKAFDCPLFLLPKVGRFWYYFNFMRTDSLNSSSEICISEGNILKYIGPIRAERNVSRPENVLIDQLLINMTSYVHKIFC